MTPDTLSSAYAYLHEILAVDPDDALERLRSLRAAHPHASFELVWEPDYAGRPRYDLLVGAPNEPTATLSLTPQEAVPFAMRGAQRWPESQLVSVDGRRVFVHEAMLAIDAIWNETRLLDRLVDMCIVGRELEREPVDIDDDALQAAVDRFRTERGLFDASEAEAWLSSRGMGLHDLERALTRELSVLELRRRLVGAEAEASFGADPRRWDRVALAAFAADDYGHAVACVEALRAGEPWLALAERVLTARGDEARASRTILFESVWRGRVETLGGFGLGDSMYLAARIEGRGPYVVQVRTIEPAVWNDSTREAIEQELFTAWLARARAAAHVEWNWGRDAA